MEIKMSKSELVDHTRNTAAAPYINIGSGSSYITWTGGNTATTTKI